VDRGTERAEHVDERTSPRYDRGTLAAAADTVTDTVTDTATDRRVAGSISHSGVWPTLPGRDKPPAATDPTARAT